MSFLHLKNKSEPKYFEDNISSIHKKISDTKPTTEENNLENPNNSLMIGQGTKIIGTIKSSHHVTIQGTIDGDIDCKSVTINRSGIVKGKKIKTDTLTCEGKVEGEIHVNEVLIIKSNGSVNGKIFYSELKVDKGGQLSGEINCRDKDNKQEVFKELKSLS